MLYYFINFIYLILGTNQCRDGSDERQDCPPCPSGQVNKKGQYVYFVYHFESYFILLSFL